MFYRLSEAKYWFQAFWQKEVFCCSPNHLTEQPLTITLGLKSWLPLPSALILLISNWHHRQRRASGCCLIGPWILNGGWNLILAKIRNVNLLTYKTLLIQNLWLKKHSENLFVIEPTKKHVLDFNIYI